jgi:hypothetical protein
MGDPRPVRGAPPDTGGPIFVKGLLLSVRRGRVVAITAKSARIEQPSGARLTYTRRSPEVECVAVWELPTAWGRSIKTPAATDAEGTPLVLLPELWRACRLL